MKRTLLILFLVAALTVGGWFGLSQLRSQQTAQAISQYQTVPVTRGDLSSTVGATGTVRSNQSGMVVWQSSGTVGEMDIALGEPVRQGQVLARLLESSLPQSMILARADLVDAQKALERLTESDVARATAYQKLVEAQKELNTANTRRLSKEYRRGSDSTIQERTADVMLAQDAYNNALDNWNLYSGRDDTDLGKANALSRLAAARKALDQAKANLNYVQTMPDDVEVAAADARIQLAEANLKDAQNEWDRLKEGPDAREIEAAEARILAIQNTLSMDKITAPFAGTITEVKCQPGDPVSPGTQAYRIDDLSRLLVDVAVTEVDINRIKPGQEATLTFDAIQNTEYRAKVVEVAQVGSNVSGVVNFNVILELLEADDQVRPGMTAAVTVNTEQAKAILLVPNRAIRLNQGQYYVYILKNGLPVRTNITLGLTSESDAQVLSGVSEGDLIVLNPPTQLQMTGPGMVE